MSTTSRSGCGHLIHVALVAIGVGVRRGMMTAIDAYASRLQISTAFVKRFDPGQIRPGHCYRRERNLLEHAHGMPRKFAFSNGVSLSGSSIVVVS